VTSERVDIIRDKLKILPAGPGVYLFSDKDGTVIYIGKAKVLRNRVRSYFQSKDHDLKTAVMVTKVRDIEWILTESEVEALLLENNLVKEKRPQYNINLKDDKSFPFIRVTQEDYPRIFITRNVVKDGSKYFGPYTNTHNLRKTMKIIHRIFPLRTCRYTLDEVTVRGGKVALCLEYHMKNCEGPCQGLVAASEYQDMVKRIIQFLNGHTQGILEDLQGRMLAAAGVMDFETAARYRDQLAVLKDYSSRQNIVNTDFNNRDILSLALGERDAVALVFRIREGNIIGREHFQLKKQKEHGRDDVLKDFIRRYYEETSFVPKELVTELSSEETLYEEYLSRLAGHRVHILKPERGDKAKLLTLAKKNADMLLKDILLQKMKLDSRPSRAVEGLQESLNLPVPPLRIEGFDISNIQGTNTVASMVSFENGKPKKSDYRRFIIRTVEGPDDFASMKEVVQRRYARLLEEGAALPDLVLIDGGKGQLNAAKSVLDGLNLENLPVIGLAKRLEEVFIPGYSQPQNIAKTSPALSLLRRIRDEAHRFAITFHRERRDRQMVKSVLDDIRGLGPKRRELLNRHFPDIADISASSEKEIADKCKFSLTLASEILKKARSVKSAQASGSSENET